MIRNSTLVAYWRYMDGWENIPFILRDETNPDMPTCEFREELVGWHCHVRPDNDREFVKWMSQNMKGKYECTHRFNSGDPMYTVCIKDDEDATLFKLRWM